MWIIRHGDEGDDVPRTHGLVPVAINGRFYAAKRNRERFGQGDRGGQPVRR